MPQQLGLTSEALDRLDGIRGVRVGKAIRFELEAPDEASARAHADEVTQRFLINPVIEDADVTLSVVEAV